MALRECSKTVLARPSLATRLTQTVAANCQQEVWNELWGMSGGVTPPCTSDPCIGGHYMALYNASAVAIKAVDPSLKVGGPATERECGIGWLRL